MQTSIFEVVYYSDVFMDGEPKEIINFLHTAFTYKVNYACFVEDVIRQPITDQYSPTNKYCVQLIVYINAEDIKQARVVSDKLFNAHVVSPLHFGQLITKINKLENCNKKWVNKVPYGVETTKTVKQLITNSFELMFCNSLCEFVGNRLYKITNVSKPNMLSDRLLDLEIEELFGRSLKDNSKIWVMRYNTKTDPVKVFAIGENLQDVLPTFEINLINAE